MATIRKADLPDVPALIRLGELFHRDSKLEQLYPLDPNYTAHNLRRLIRSPRCEILVLCADGEIVGGIGFTAISNYFNKEVVIAFEQFFWVLPEHRGLRNAQALLKATEQAAREIKCSHISMIALENLAPDRVGKLYEYNGYVPLEHIYTKRL